MTNTELTLDQLQAVSGGATGIEYGLISALLSRDQVSIECKVPPRSFKNTENLFYQVEHY